jgi:8-oxo-dGTP diphosphatase
MQAEVTVKLVVFSIINSELKLFYPDGIVPFQKYVLGDSLDTTAQQIFKRIFAFPVQDLYVEQLYTFSTNKKVKEGITVVYYLLLPPHKIPTGQRNDFLNISSITTKNSDTEIISYAVLRLRWKIEYTNAVYSLLPEAFTLSELQTVYEAILGKALDKRNFRKKIISLNILRSTGRTRQGIQARPALIYTFKVKKPEFVKVF